MTDNDVRLHIYEQFVATGAPPPVEDTAEALGVAPEEAEDAYRRLEAARIIVLAPGTTNVWMANPLSAYPTPFRVRTPRGNFWGNCVWDALGVVAMLGGDGRIETRCPDCQEPMNLEVSDGALRPAEGVAHFAVPAKHWWGNIGYT